MRRLAAWTGSSYALVAVALVTLSGCGLARSQTVASGLARPASRFSLVRVTTSTTSSGCAASDAGFALRSTRAGATTSMVPAGAKTLMICRYNGMNAFGGVPQWGLRGKGATSDPATITALARALNALKPVPRNEAFSCPSDDSSSLLAFFGYASGASNPVTIDIGGCGNVTNGHLSRMFGGAITQRMLALVKPVKLATATLEGTIAGCVRSQLAKRDCPQPDRVVVRIGSGWIGLVQPAHGHFRLHLAIGGRVTISLYGEGQRVNALIATTTATVKIGHTTKVVLVPRPFGVVRGLIRNCGQGMSVPCSTRSFPDGMSVRVQTPSQRGAGNLVIFQPMSDRFDIPLPPGRYRFTLLGETGHLIRGVTGSMVTVRTHHTTDAVLTIPTG